VKLLSQVTMKCTEKYRFRVILRVYSRTCKIRCSKISLVPSSGKTVMDRNFMLSEICRKLCVKY